MQPDEGAGVRSGDESGQKRAFEREIGGVVAEQQARGDAGGERNAQAEREQQPVGPGAALGNQDVAEAVVPNQHGRQRGDDRDLDDQRRQQKLIGRQELSAAFGTTGKLKLNPS